MKCKLEENYEAQKKQAGTLRERFKEQLFDLFTDKSDEIVEFDAKDFDGYRQYDRAYPDRFRVKYDENLNRIW